MTEQEAFKAAEEHCVEELDGDCCEVAAYMWNAALAWLRSQGEPVAVTTQSNINAMRNGAERGIFARDPVFAAMAPRETDVPLYAAPQPAIPDGWQSVAARDVLAERRRQVEAEGWTPKHDDRHGDRSLVLAAACYAKQYVGRAWLVESLSDGEERYKCDRVPDNWPDSWAEEWWKPKDPRRDLVRAAALILAEIERLDRRMLVTAPELSK